MTNKAAVSTLLFRAVSLLFSAILLLLALVSNVKLMAAEIEIEELEKKLETTAKETEILRVRLENRLSLEEIETLALTELGMHRPGAEQLYFDMIPG